MHSGEYPLTAVPFTVTIQDSPKTPPDEWKHVNASFYVTKCLCYINKDGPFHIVLSLHSPEFFGNAVFHHSGGSLIYNDIIAGSFTINTTYDDSTKKKCFLRIAI